MMPRRCSTHGPCSQDAHSLVWGTQFTQVTNEEPMEVLEEEFTCAKCYLMGIRQVLVTEEDLRQGRGGGEALSELLRTCRGELTRPQVG